MPDASALAAELDAIHANARANYRARDLNAFLSVFSPTLKYRQPDGRTIGRNQLAKDVASQLASLQRGDTFFVRESLEIDGDRAIEVLVQTASLTFRRFFFFKHTWRLTRRGRYTWVRYPDGWKIQEVDVLSESVVRGAA